MGLFSFLRPRDERAIPEPGTPEFEAAVKGSALPDEQSVEMGQPGWASTERGSSERVHLRGTEAREQILSALRSHGIDPERPGQTIDAARMPGLREAIFSALGEAGVRIPGAGGFGGGINAPPQDPLAQLEHLARLRDSGQLTEAEFRAQKKRLLGG